MSVLLALLAFAFAIPALATSSKKAKVKRPSIPSCTHFSPKAMAKVLGAAPLKFKGRTPHSNLCTWEGSKPGHYHQTLSIEVIPGIKSVYALAESDGKKTAAKQGKTFGTIPSRHNPWKAAFFVTGTTTDAGLQPCPPDHKVPKFGPPGCSGDPNWTTIDVDSYDSKLMVSAGIAAQQGDVHLGHMIELNKEILTGKIR